MPTYTREPTPTNVPEKDGVAEHFDRVRDFFRGKEFLVDMYLTHTFTRLSVRPPPACWVLEEAIAG
jgi:hypothetical protein